MFWGEGFQKALGYPITSIAGFGLKCTGVYGPPMGQTAIIFVDDLNMPEVETYGAQPPLELLRQMVDNGGW